MKSLLRADNLTVSFRSERKRWTHALKNLSFEIPEGKTVGLVGESGSGKTTVARSLCGLVPLSSGRIFYRDHCISDLSRSAAFFPYRRKIQMVFQDPYGSLNPRMRLEHILSEPLDIHFPEKTKEEKQLRIQELLNLVHLPQNILKRYPHEFSGGQRQRIAIARALAVNPELLICDEALSALDVTVQVQVIHLLKELQNQLNLTYLFIAHDLAVVQELCDFVIVMKAGEAVEQASRDALYSKPKHPYTQALLDACYSV